MEPHIVFSGGGTGGHLFPGLAVAEHLWKRMPQARITFAGSGKSFEQQTVEQAGFAYLPVRCCPAPRRLRDVATFVIENVKGYQTARRFVVREAVDAVVGLGGYASVPMSRAAVNCRVPLVLLEQNAAPGRATRWLARRAAAVCLALPDAGACLPTRCAITVTGNPLRSGFVATDPRHKQLLVLGGSGGARTLNQQVPAALAHARGSLQGWRIVHQTGIGNAAATQQLYQELGIPAEVVEFIADMPAMLRATGLAVCRAGGTTLAELAAAGVPAVLLPYPHAVDDHQRCNAGVFCRAGGAILIDEREHVGRVDRELAQTLAPLSTDEAARERMAAGMHSFAHPRAAQEVAEIVLKLIARCTHASYRRAA